ncbi:MAG: DUF4160 domain-containing protein [Taibaiella sp.]|nr:DUF4160 domain-containing protein [Taibaiella sp.]
MPNIAVVDGVKINVYANDHLPPHIHAIYAEYEALIAIAGQTAIQGFLPRKQLKTACEFVTCNETALPDLFYQLNTKLRK